MTDGREDWKAARLAPPDATRPATRGDAFAPKGEPSPMTGEAFEERFSAFWQTADGGGDVQMNEAPRRLHRYARALGVRVRAEAGGGGEIQSGPVGLGARMRGWALAALLCTATATPTRAGDAAAPSPAPGEGAAGASPSVTARLEGQLDSFSAYDLVDARNLSPPPPRRYGDAPGAANAPGAPRAVGSAGTNRPDGNAPVVGTAASAAAPGGTIAEHADAFRRARTAEANARELGRVDPSRVGDAELGWLTEAILEYEAVGRATGAGEAYAAAWHGVARCEYRIGRLWAAHEALQKSYPEKLDVLLVTARVSLQSAIADALYARGHKDVPGGGPEGRPTTGYAAARTVYRAVVVNDRMHPRAARALVRHGLCSLELGDLDSAEGAFRQVVAEYTRGAAVFEARTRLAQTLLARYRNKPEIPPDAAREIDALLAEAGYDEDAIRRFRRSGGAADAEVALTPADLARLEHNAQTQHQAWQHMPGPALASGDAAGSGPDAKAVPARVPGATEPGAGAAALETLAAERDEHAAAKLVQQAQVFLRQGDRQSKAAAEFQLTDAVRRFPATPSAEVARSLLARHFAAKK